MSFWIFCLSAYLKRAFTATNRIEMLVHQPFGSLCTALATYAGQNYGADRIDRVKKGLRDSGIPLLVLNLTGIGVMGIWWSAALTWGVSALFCVLRYAAWRRQV